MDDLETLLADKKASLMSSLKDYYDKSSPSTNDLIECMRLGNVYFNEAEHLVSDSKIKGKHNDGLWVTDMAESCESILDSYLIYINFLTTQSEKLNYPYEKPSLHACSSMQRMVKIHCNKKSSKELRRKFLDAKLPTTGFDVKHRDDIENKNPYITLIIGLLAIGLSFGTTMFVSNLTSLKVFMIRVLFGLGCAACASFIPGWLKINFNGYVKAGGAIGILIIIYFFNPPTLLGS